VLHWDSADVGTGACCAVAIVASRKNLPSRIAKNVCIGPARATFNAAISDRCQALHRFWVIDEQMTAAYVFVEIVPLRKSYRRRFRRHTLVIEGSFKPGKKTEFNAAWRNEILPTLKQQNGFVDEILLFETTNPNRGMGLSFWKSREDAERYHREVFPRLANSVQNLMEAPPSVRSFDVEASETFRIAGSKAAWGHLNGKEASHSSWPAFCD